MATVTVTNGKSGLATAGLVVGIIGVCLSLIPIVNNVSFILAILALVFGIVGIVQTGKDKKAGRGKAIAAVVLGAATLVLVLVSQAAFNNALNSVNDAVNEQQSTSESTQEQAPAAEWDIEAAYAKVENGMTKAQVEEATGRESTNCTETENEYTGKLETCSYGNVLTDSGHIIVTYTNDAVSSKTKAEY